jgi:transcription antitermination factor NusG
VRDALICKHVLVCPSEEKARLAAEQEEDGRMKKRQVREGQIVRVVDGPLTGFRGEVKEVDEQNSIAKVAVQAFGRVASMDLALGQIERVPKSSN